MIASSWSPSFTKFVFKHYFYKANRYANNLARLGVHQSQYFILIDYSSVDLDGIFNSDGSGLHLTKRCPETLVLTYFNALSFSTNQKKKTRELRHLNLKIILENKTIYK